MFVVQLLLIGLLFMNPASAFEVVTPNVKSVHASFVFAYKPNGPPITLFKTTMVIPPLPTTQSGQAIALWPGMQTEDSGTVLQPVVQFGDWANGEVKSWHLSTWVVVYPQGGHTAKFIASSKVPVEPGTRVTAVMELISLNNGTYTYRGYFENYPGTEAVHTMKEKFNSLFLEYEMQHPKKCSDYVREVVFSNTQVYTGTRKLNLTWSPKTEDPINCGITVRPLRINAGGSVRIGLP